MVDAQSRGGGACLTPFRRELIARYQTIERDVVHAAKTNVGAVEDVLAPHERGV